MAAGDRIVMLDPTAGPVPTSGSVAPRLPALDGKVLGLLANSKANSNKVLDYVCAELTGKYGVKAAVRVSKGSASRPAEPELIARLKQECDGVITGIGDWGSCSSGSVLDGVLLERAGVPAAVICTEPFTSSGKAMAGAHGLPGYGFAVIPHPINVTADDELRRWAAGVADDVARLLVG